MEVNRRDFLKVVGTAGASLMIAVYLEPGSRLAAAAQADAVSEDTFQPNLYIKIDKDSKVTITAFRSEMGQGIRTAIAMIVADELNADWDSVIIEQASADPDYGDQVTGGSASISSYYGSLRIAGATGREMLKSAAAAQWEVDAAECSTDSGFVIHPDGQQKLPYGDLVESASEVDAPEMWTVPLKPESEFSL
ncbi:MAG: molybdopterin-dependent oxidoreductase, partial [Chloroflexi bacterium]|nr:molybdopterin-dependent oxidoreductase [Chloroflexota bacterium]